ncbi:hypothetical protein LTR37_021285 [Vermiconidia calcicola]|uniref:Uncharacterized protein n=1 Tax=Vermiconidia calcicola TaxID=1690605 RepID=A0ACC3MAA5_9PEZI|nr:hypothetical protein LTR37_021285 [Vermiconidia calcicola]
MVLCRNGSIPPNGAFSTTCELMAHPYQSWRLETLCPRCEYVRARLMNRIDSMQGIKYDEEKWKVSYGMPAHGKDFWGRKAEERENLSKDTGKKKKKSLRFSWKRSKNDARTEE